MADLSLSGLASGFDWKTVVEQLANLERAPQRRLRREQSTINQRKDAVSTLVSELENLKSKSEALTKSDFFTGSGTATSTNDKYATATSTSSTPVGNYTFVFDQLATAAIRKGGTDAGGAVNTNATFSSSGSAGFAVQVTTGYFTINGQQITVDSNTKLGTDGSTDPDTIIYKINNSGAGVTATYDSATDKITLTAGSNITLGASGDTSNFLQAARLSNSQGQSSTIVSSTGIGGVNPASTVSSVNFSTALTDTSGSFKINGVSVSYAASDTISTMLQRITDSAAGVVAAYDSANDQFTLTNKTTGDIGISLEDVSGNFLAATRLSSGTTMAGQNAKFTVNDGPQLESLSNTLSEISHGIAGLTVRALKQTETSGADSSVTITVGKDNATIKKGITDFVDQYNKVQSVIDSQTASSTDATGKVTSGILAADTMVVEVASKLRNKMVADVSGLSGTIKRLESIGLKTDGNTNRITVLDEAALDEAISDNKTELKTLFAGASDGVGTRVEKYLDTVSGLDGSLVSHRDTYAKQSTQIDQQVVEMEKQVQSYRQRLIDSFLAMEKAQSQINQQMQFLLQRFQ
ncbi:MAG: flagellar filament capping protein FliD [Verrucomicrobia bacterium]|nr:flagellar filament capping protein FliD [Verrucomicrobiota bacterium]